MLAALAVSCSTREFTFVHMADTQIGMCDTSAHFRVTDSLMHDAVIGINHMKPDCVIITGDLVNNWDNDEQRAIYKARIAEIDPSIPVYAVPGNHDHPDFSQEVMEHYDDLVGYDRFSFTSHGCAFIGFDSCVALYGTPEAEEEQYGWLEEELKKACGRSRIFVFFHCPLALRSIDEAEQWDNFPMEKRKRYLELFRKYGVNAMFTGHTHSLNVAEFDGIKSFNACAVSYAFEGNVTGFNVVKVTPEALDVNFTNGQALIDK